MTTLILSLATQDGARRFEVLVSFEERLVLAESCVEVYADGRREWRDSRSVLLALGRAPRAPEGQP